ncbi:hypothetical protein AB0C12_35265 [Actinoplanes sp. NPDC048967]|uniref:hypothetical protein n=1 Tax=Actinoplanes sp. NPDC048967 TaxID=3155269 RepID=UPI0033FF3873
MTIRLKHNNAFVRRPIRTALVAAICLGGVASATPAAAATPDPAPAGGHHSSFLKYSALDAGEWSANGSANWPETFCKINGSAFAFLAKIEQSDGSSTNGLVVQTHADIHNPWVFVGCTLRLYVDVIGTDGVTMKTFAYEPSAGAWVSGTGDRTYTYVDSLVMPQPRLDRIDHLRLRFSNV